MILQSPTVLILLVSVLVLFTQTTTLTCPPEYCSFCSKEVVHCSGLSFEVLPYNLEYILRNLGNTVKDTLHNFRLQFAVVKDLTGTSFGAWLPKLRQLTLVQCNIEKVNENTFHNLTKLTDLSLRNNSMTNFSFSILNSAENIQKFDLSSNSIMRLENPTRRLFPEMRDLDLGDNHLSTIEPGVLEYFPNLEKLTLRNNPLKHFAKDTFKGLGKLLSLDLSHANIKEIFDWYFVPLQSLETLELEHSLNAVARQFPKLTFPGLERLKRFNLRSNSLDAIDSLRHRSLRNLVFLDLSNNHISEIKNDSFAFLENLQILKLSHMQVRMRAIPNGAFLGLPKLMYLDLQGNYLTSLPLAALEPIKFAKISLAYGNRFLCNCSLIPMKTDIQQGVLKTDIYCHINTEQLFLSQMTNIDLGCTAPSLNNGKNETIVISTVGSTATILCNATSSEEFPRLTYYAKQGDPIPRHKISVYANESMTILPDRRKRFVTIKEIIVRNVETDNAGIVVCSGNTQYGSSESFVSLRVREQEAPLSKWTIGIVASLVTVLAVIIVIAVALTWRRRRNLKRRQAEARRRQRTRNASSETIVPNSENSGTTPATPQPVISETSL